MYFDKLSSIPDFSASRILVIGDLMLDRYVRGTVDRISPESPVPVLRITHTDTTLGGAGNVVRNLSTLGCNVNIMARIGDDKDGQDVSDMLNTMDISDQYLLRDHEHPTIVKTRYVSGMHQLLRADAEDVNPPATPHMTQLITQVEQIIPQHNVVIISDYGKGLLTEEFITNIITCAKQHNIPVLIDPKGRNFAKYTGAFLITPNRKELSEALDGQTLDTDDKIQSALSNMAEKSNIANILVTRSEEGMSLYEPQSTEPFTHFRTTAQEVFDVSGAGDTVIATIAAALGAGLSLQESVALSNIAGGIVVGKVGTSTIHTSELEQKLSSLSSPTTAPPSETSLRAHICSWDEALIMVNEWKAQGLKVGLTNGSFDLLHPGHVTYLNASRERCDKLIVALNTDDSIKRYKSKDRPVNDLVARTQVMAALGSVDMVVAFGGTPEEDDKPLKVIELLKPDMYFKGGDYTLETLPETPLVQGYGGIVEIIQFVDGYSTTNIIQKMQGSSTNKDEAA